MLQFCEFLVKRFFSSGKKGAAASAGAGANGSKKGAVPAAAANGNGAHKKSQ